MKLQIILTFLHLLFFSSISFTQNYQYTNHGSLKLAYRIFGEGAPLLLLNGGPGFPSTHFGQLAEKLAKNRQVILFDQRGTGKSTLPSLDTTTIQVKLMVEDIESLRRHLEIESWTVMGHSWGGMYAMCYADKHPERIDGLILSASGGMDLSFLENVGEALREKLTAEEVRELNYYSAHPDLPNARQKRLEAMAPAYVYHREHVPTVIKYLGELSAFVPEVNRLVWRDLQATDYDLKNNFSNFNKPVLIVQGKQDIISVASAQITANAFPRSEIVLIDECSHYLWLDQPEQYFAALQHYLSQ